MPRRWNFPQCSVNILSCQSEPFFSRLSISRQSVFHFFVIFSKTANINHNSFPSMLQKHHIISLPVHFPTDLCFLLSALQNNFFTNNDTFLSYKNMPRRKNPPRHAVISSLFTRQSASAVARYRCSWVFGDLWQS